MMKSHKIISAIQTDLSKVCLSPNHYEINTYSTYRWKEKYLHFLPVVEKKSMKDLR